MLKSLYGVMSPDFVSENSPVFVHESLQNKPLNVLPAQIVIPFQLPQLSIHVISQQQHF